MSKARKAKVKCAQCGRRIDMPASATAEPTWCTTECADAWMDAHPDEKQRRGWLTSEEFARSAILHLAVQLPASPTLRRVITLSYACVAAAERHDYHECARIMTDRDALYLELDGAEPAIYRAAMRDELPPEIVGRILGGGGLAS